MTRPLKNYFPLANDENYALIINYKKSLAVRDIKSETSHTYLKIIYNFMIYLQDYKIRTVEVTLEDFEDYIESKDVTPKAKIKIISVIQQFFFYLRRAGYIEKNEIERFDKRKLRKEMRENDVQKRR